MCGGKQSCPTQVHCIRSYGSWADIIGCDVTSPRGSDRAWSWGYTISPFPFSSTMSLSPSPPSPSLSLSLASVLFPVPFILFSPPVITVPPLPLQDLTSLSAHPSAQLHAHRSTHGFRVVTATAAPRGPGEEQGGGGGEGGAETSPESSFHSLLRAVCEWVPWK